MRYSNFCAVITLALLAVSNVFAQAPDSLSFQGRLTDSNGAAIDTPSVSMTFKLYKNGSPVWEENHPAVTVEDGVFNVLLGGITPLDTMAFNVPLLLGIMVGGDTEISPRTPLAAAAYARALPGFFTFYREDSEPNKSYSVVGGAANNVVGEGVVGATIGGGGGIASGFAHPNSVLADFGTVSGGSKNTSTGYGATVGGGQSNIAGEWATVGGGFFNTAGGDSSTVGGGGSNSAGGIAATVGGGSRNTAEGILTTVAGGSGNTAINAQSFVGGGLDNEALAFATTIGGGESNKASSPWATVGGGNRNEAKNLSTVVAGGVKNIASGLQSTIAGGGGNRAFGFSSTVAGGVNNTASGANSVVPGGDRNVARGDYSFAAGYKAKAEHEGTLVWNDRSVTGGNDSLVSTGPNQFLIRADGGVGIGTNSPDEQLHILKSNAGSAIKLGGRGTGGPHGIVFDDNTPNAGVQLFWRTGLNRLVIEDTSRGTSVSDGNAPDAFYYARDSKVFAFAGKVRPMTDNTWSLGQSNRRWTEVWATDGTINTSDERLKTDIEDIENGLNNIMDLRPVRYRWIDDSTGNRNLGLIAQEVEQIVPEVVRAPVNDSVYYGLNYSHLVPLLINAIQEQQAMIESLQTTIDDLLTARGDQDGRLAALEARLRP